MTGLGQAASTSGDSRGRALGRFALAALYLVAAGFHLAKPEPFLGITPGLVPWAEQVILLTGVAEGAGALGLIQPWSLRLRRAAAIGLAVYAVCVFPANVNHMLLDLARPDRGLGLAYHVPRLLAQPLLVWLALWSGQVLRWPQTHAGGDRQSR